MEQFLPQVPPAADVLSAIQEYEDAAYHPSMKTQVSESANAVALAAMRAVYYGASQQLDLAKAVINKYCITCAICKFRDCCDYEVNQECNFTWDGVSI